MTGPVWDVVVVGGGPAGSSAAIAARAAGASVLLLEREELPRYKLCGGGLLQISVDSLPEGFTPPLRAEVDVVTFTHAGRGIRRRGARGGGPVLRMVYRREFDAALVEHAAALGVEVRDRCTVRDFTEADDAVVLGTPDGDIRARIVVGADGSAGRSSRHVGARFAQVDSGLETELALDADRQREWDGRVHLDWGPYPGSYGWAFPKGDQLTVGVILDRGRGSDGKRYLADLVAALGLTDAPEVSSGGHLTHCRTTIPPLARGRVLLAGDAAGLLEPWTREGISFALRSGRLAGDAAARVVRGHSPLEVGAWYSAHVDTTLGAEMRAGRECLRAFERHPGWFHLVIARTGPGWDAFRALTTGRTTFVRLLRHRVVRIALAVRSADGFGRIGPMARWVAFLRGVNVGGIKVTSAALRSCLEDIGLTDVATVLASGNAVFISPRKRAPLKKAVEQALRDTFGYDAWIVLFDSADVAAAIDRCSLQPRDGWHTYFLLGSDEQVLDELDGLAPDDEPHARGPHVLYWQVEEGQTLKTPFAKMLAKPKYKAHTTMRNARTMAKVAALL